MGDRVAEDTKPEPLRDASEDSSPSSPEQDGEQVPDQPQVQKRKGGRKPIYATSEERKQRNRQAQAAFRERRTEYIKQLETTIKHHEEALQTLQQSHRTAADECLMLRYKNSLLERILLEKGIDVQAELRAKTGSPTLAPERTNGAITAPPQSLPVQRTSAGKGHQPRRYITHPTPQKIETPQMAPLPESVLPGLANPSPRSQPTPTTSHFSSPANGPTRSPNFFPQAGTTISPNLVPQAQQRSSQPPLRPNLTPMQPPQRPSLTATYTSSSTVSSNSPTVGSATTGATSATSSGPGNAIYPNQFKSHYDQLEQEYDAATDMVDDSEVQSPQAGPGPYPQAFPPQGNMHPPPQPMQTTPHLQPMHTTPTLPPQQQPQQQHQAQQQHHHQSPYQQTQDSSQAAAQYGGINPNMNTFFDPYDPMLDADPFGLSASMHFPTQFSYDAR